MTVADPRPQIVELLGFDEAGGRRRRTIASGAVVSIRDFLVLSDENTAAIHTTTPLSVCAGLADEQKKGDGEDFTTRITAVTEAIIDAYASGAIRVGQPLALSDVANFVQGAVTGQSTSAAAIRLASGAEIIGYSEAAASDQEQFRMHFKIGG